MQTSTQYEVCTTPTKIWKQKLWNKNDVLQNMTFISVSSHLSFLSNWGKKSMSIYSENTLIFKNSNVEILQCITSRATKI